MTLDSFSQIITIHFPQKHDEEKLRVEFAPTPGTLAFLYVDEKKFEELEQYLVTYCQQNSLTLKELFLGKGGKVNKNCDDFDSVPLQKAAIAMWNWWSNEQKIYSTELSLKKGIPLESLLTDECEQVREGAKLYSNLKKGERDVR